MPLRLLPSLLVMIVLVGFTPGPANLYAMACCLRYGRRRALRMWRGLLVGFAVAVTAMAVLTHLLDELMAGYVVYLKYIGAAYILWLAWRMFRYSGQTDPEARDCSFTSGVVLQLTNAKMLLLDLTAFSVYVLPYSDDLSDLLVVAALLHVAGPVANLVWLYAGAYMRRFLMRHRASVDVVMSLLLAACAVYIVLC